MGLLTLLLSCAIIACNNGSSQPESPQFTADENYLIDSYVQVKRASSYYPYQPGIADSLLTGLAAQIDTVRVSRTINELNQTPERWAAVYQAIGERLRDAGRKQGSEGSGGGAGTPAEVQKDDEDH